MWSLVLFIDVSLDPDDISILIFCLTVFCDDLYRIVDDVNIDTVDASLYIIMSY